MDLQRGARLGSFTVERRLGRGASGAVYLARDARDATAEPVALKVLSPHLTDDDEVRARFRHAVAVAARLEHPGICRVFAVHEERGVVFLAMQALEGQTLAQALDARGALGPEETLQVLRGLAPPLDAAHALGVVHRDLKPANIMVGPRREITILDFGMVQADDVTRIAGVGRTVGSLRFIAPEVWQGRPATARSDIYALGVVLAMCLTGRHPDDLAAIDVDGVARPPPRLTPHNPGVRRTVEAVVRRCMAPDPTRRFGSAREVERAFEEAVAADAAVELADALVRLHEAALDEDEPPPSRRGARAGALWLRQRVGRVALGGTLAAGAAAVVGLLATTDLLLEPSSAASAASDGARAIVTVEAPAAPMCWVPSPESEVCLATGIPPTSHAGAAPASCAASAMDGPAGEGPTSSCAPADRRPDPRR